MLNLLYINTHDTGRHLSPYGFQVNTPSLLELAKDATLFTQAYSVSPTCSPSRASMLTSTLPHVNGMLGLAQRGFSLNEPKKHLANYLKENGFDTALCGIQHEVSWYFDVDPEAIHEIGYQEILTQSAKEFRKEEYHLWDHENAIAAASWLKNRKSDKPFMLSFGLHSTHRPYPLEVDSNIDERYVQPAFPLPSNEITRKDQAQFLTSAQQADQSIGLIIDTLKEMDLYDNTLILYTTDHGLALPFHKTTLRDDGIGVGMILRHPSIGHGKVVDQLVSHLDVFPTICEILKLDVPNYVEGVSIVPLLHDEKQKIRDEIYAQVNFHTSYEPIRAIRNSRYKYIRYFDETWKKFNLSNMDEGTPKDFLIENDLQALNKDLEAFYDCLYDPHEVNNVIDDPQYSEIVEAMRQKLLDEMRRTDDPLLKGELPIEKHYKVNKKHVVFASSKNEEDYDPRGRTK